MVKLIEKNEIEDSFQSIICDISSLFKQGLKVSRLPDGSISAGTGALELLSSVVRAGGADKTLRSMVIDAIKRAEKVAPGCSYVFVDLLENLSSVDSGDIAVLRNLMAPISKAWRPVTFIVLNETLKKRVPNVADILIEAIELAGSECKIFVEPSVTRQTSVERLTGYTFRCDADPQFFKSGKWIAHNVKCLIIDGTIDKISEIDSLLQRCNAEKTSMVIFARGFDREVYSTLRTNHARKTLNVIPVVVGFDLETANVLLDIATAMGTDVVSSLKGDLISSIKFDDLLSAQAVTCSAKSTVISCQPGAALDTHINNLLQKRQLEPIPLIKQILDQRLRSLSSSSVVIKVDDSGAQGGQKMHDLDEGLKIIKSMLSYGIIRRDDLLQISQESSVLDIIEKSFAAANYPTVWVLSVIDAVTSLISTIRSVKLMVSES